MDPSATHTLASICAGLFSLLAVVISVRQIYLHQKHFTRPMVQKKMVGILWMVPIYAVHSWLSLQFQGASVYLDLFRDCYEAYVIYLFLSLMVVYVGDGDEYRVAAVLESLPPLKQPFPFHWLPPVQLGMPFLISCKLAAMQFVVLKPLTTFVAVLLETQGAYDHGTFRPDRGYVYVAIIMNVSITWAFYKLALFYVALKGPLAPYRPVPKFLCIKAVLFLTFWQSVALAALSHWHWIHDVGSYTTEDVSGGIQNLLICVEMFVAALAHRYAFHYREFMGGRAMRTSLLKDNLALDDAARDFNQVIPGPVVLPTGFRPSVDSSRSAKPRVEERQEAEQGRSEPEQLRVQQSLDADAEEKGWSL